MSTSSFLAQLQANLFSLRYGIQIAIRFGRQWHDSFVQFRQHQFLQFIPQLIAHLMMMDVGRPDQTPLLQLFNTRATKPLRVYSSTFTT